MLTEQQIGLVNALFVHQHTDTTTLRDVTSLFADLSHDEIDEAFAQVDFDFTKLDAGKLAFLEYMIHSFDVPPALKNYLCLKAHPALSEYMLMPHQETHPIPQALKASLLAASPISNDQVYYGRILRWYDSPLGRATPHAADIAAHMMIMVGYFHHARVAVWEASEPSPYPDMPESMFEGMNRAGIPPKVRDCVIDRMNHYYAVRESGELRRMLEKEGELHVGLSSPFGQTEEAIRSLLAGHPEYDYRARVTEENGGIRYR